MYTGQGLGQTAGAILQSLDAVTWEAIRSTGGWVEGYVYLTPNLHNHTGIFIDDPNNNDITGLPNTLFGRTRNRGFFNTLLWDFGGETKKFRIPNTLFGRTYNRVFYSTLLWELDKSFRLGFEPTWRKTEYKEPTATGRLPNEGFGFHTQFAWTF